jgi:hypothetical protein
MTRAIVWRRRSPINFTFLRSCTVGHFWATRTRALSAKANLSRGNLNRHHHHLSHHPDQEDEEKETALGGRAATHAMPT